MSSSILKVAVFGASGNFGTPITAALSQAGFEVTIITRTESSSTFPPGIPVIRAAYTAPELTTALKGQDAVVSVIGPGGLPTQVAIIDAAVAAGVKRLIVNDFGWGPNSRTMPEFAAIGAQRKAAWDHAADLAKANPGFTWTGITIGNPIDWGMKKFPLMGFDARAYRATIYDAGAEPFTGTTLEGIGQSVVGVLTRPAETANRFVKVRSIQTCQNELLGAYEKATGRRWEVARASSRDLIESGRRHKEANNGAWRLELVVGQLYDVGQARCIVAASREASDSELLGVKEETAEKVVAKVMRMISA
ncbi:NAD(P)-binding protein [Xylariomycetidae sp. FL2044]|nr:NAD(P)-binding protein [Xylariomycetidae sp. FL2044]